LADITRPILTALRDATGESVQLYVADGEGRRCVVSLQSTHGLRWIVPQGALLPLDRGSAGRVLQGDSVAESVEEREPGVASVSAAVRDRRGTIIAALSLSGPVERLTRQPRRKFGRVVTEAADAVTAAVAR
jgi:DNA-binding IclR family transcriptional regulator